MAYQSHHCGSTAHRERCFGELPSLTPSRNRDPYGRTLIGSLPAADAVFVITPALCKVPSESAWRDWSAAGEHKAKHAKLPRILSINNTPAWPSCRKL